MRASSQKELLVYEFGADDLVVEPSSSKYAKRSLSSSLDPEEERLTKYQFLQAFNSGHKQADATDISCIDMCEDGTSKEPFAIASPDRNVSSEEKSVLDEIMAASTSYDEKGNLYLGEFDHATTVIMDPLVEAASGLLVPTVGTGNVSELQSDVPPVDVISDDEECYTSVNQSPSTSASDLAEDEDHEESPASDNCCRTYGEEDKDDMQVIVSPDYVAYGGSLYEEALLTFSPEVFMVECSDGCSQTEKFLLECAVADIIHIDCQWSGSVEGALVKFRLKAATVNRNEEIQDTSDFQQLIFSVTGMHWLENEQRIKSLSTRYEDAWNAHQFDDLILEASTRQRGKFFPNHYFLEIPHTFEDIIYPKGDPDAVSISRRDIEQLQPDTFLNDTIIDFYIKYLKGGIQPNEKHRFHFFNSFFFRKLADLDKEPGSASEGRAAFLRVRKWTRKVHIFEKDYIFIPVNFNLHWSLLVICHPGEAATAEEDNLEDTPKVPCILHMDSIKGSHSGLKNLLQSYLWEEWKERHPEAPEEHSSKFLNLRFVPLELPQQENSFDCGLFLLHYVELFLVEAPLNFSPFKITKLSKFLSMDWFSPSEASFKRYVIRKLIYGLLNYPSQKVNSSTFCNGDLSLGDCQDVLEQEPAVKFISEQCCISKMVVCNSACFDTDGETQMNHVTMSSLGASFCDKKEALLLKDFLETKANSTSSPKHQNNSFEENAPSQMLKSPTCLIEEPAHGIEQFMSSSPEKNNGGSFGECRTTETCSTSYYLKQDGVCELPWTSMQEKEINIDLLPRTLNTDHLDSDQRGEIENAGSVSLEDCGYVADISISSSAENQENGSQEVGTIKTEYSRNRENSDRIKATEATSGSDEEHQEIDTAKGEVGRTEDPQEIASSKAEEGDVIGRFEDANVTKSNSDGEDQEINTNVENSNSDGECQEINTTEIKDGGAEDSNKIGNVNTEEVRSIRNYEGIEDTNVADSGKGEENQIIDTEEYKDGNSEDCQKAKLPEAGEPGVENSEDSQVDGPTTEEAVDNDDCKMVVTSEFEDGDSRSSQQYSSISVRDSGDSCEESLQLPLFHGIEIDDEEPSEKVGMQLKREKPATGGIVRYQKRRKVQHSGVRMHTRSQRRDFPS